MFSAILDGPPFCSDVEPTPEGNSIVVPISHEPEKNRIASVSTSLALTWIETEEVWELSFDILVVSIDDSEAPFSTQDRTMAEPYIPREIRPKIMDVVADSARTLVAQQQPAAIYLVAKIAGLPEKAMAKYYMLIKALLPLGYSLASEGTDWSGRPYWLLKLG